MNQERWVLEGVLIGEKVLDGGKLVLLSGETLFHQIRAVVFISFSFEAHEEIIVRD